MGKKAQIEVRSQFAIDPVEQVEIELRRHSRAIVVRGFNRGGIFFEIDPDQQSAIPTAEPRNSSQQFRGLSRHEVANGRARKVDRGVRRTTFRNRQIEISGEVVQTERISIRG